LHNALKYALPFVLEESESIGQNHQYNSATE
jgi:hypothetical protein